MLIPILVALVISVVAVEYCFWFFSNTWLSQNIKAVGTTINSFVAAKTDEERQKLVLSLSGKIFALSLVFLLFLAVLALLVFVYPIELTKAVEFNNVYYLAITAGGFIYAAIRLKTKTPKPSETSSTEAQRYSVLEKLLHWLALDSKLVRRVSFDLERALFLPKNKKGNLIDDSSPVYVCGLARSGTTIVLEILDQIDEFCSLNYRSMPFVLSPNGWGAMSRLFYKEHKSEEREHGDGIMFGFDSPEAFEEVFWNSFSTPLSENQGLGYKEPSKELIADFRDYRALVCRSAARSRTTDEQQTPSSAYRYLSKNNNNVIRLRSLLESSPQARVLVVYRDPFDTAASLYRQHQSFLKTQEQDPFIRSYMDWLGHHEFGFGHKPFQVAKQNMSGNYVADQQDYWLEYWIALHQYLLTTLEGTQSSIALLSHNRLRDEPSVGLQSVFDFLNLSQSATALAEKIEPNTVAKHESSFDPQLSSVARELFDRLAKHPLNIINEQI